MKVIQVGIYPPPVGGISMHIKRLKHGLEQEGHSCFLLNEGVYENKKENILKEKTIGSFLKIVNPSYKILHFHSISMKKRVLMSFFKLFNKKIILTIHGNSLEDQIKGLTGLKKTIFITSLKKIDRIICVNNDTEKFLIDLRFSSTKVKSIPAYLNPIDVENDYLKIPKEVWSFIEEQELLITANGNVCIYKEKDLYGINTLIELVDFLRKENPNIGLLFALLGVNNQSEEEKEYYNFLKRKIKDLQLEDNIYFFEVVDNELYPILKKTHIFIRPTVSDGYGVSIAEALNVNTVSIASDVCPRPNGTLLYKVGKPSELNELTKNVIENFSMYKNQVCEITTTDYYQEIVQVYKELID